ncbi:terpene cyclase [Taiwanofungus camphoratus]|nr:terpene cyclase [Antrodia cinnamomea]
MSIHSELSHVLSAADIAAPMDKETIASVSQQTIRDFLDKISLTFSDYKRDLELEARVKEIVHSWGYGEDIRPHVVTALILTTTAYSHIASMDTKVQITLFTTLIIAFDDPAILNALASSEFHQRVCTGAAQRGEDMLGKFMRVLSGMWEHYAPFAANSIFASALRFVNVSILENESGDMKLHSEALPFIEYRRSMSATAEAYACFIWDKEKFPDVQLYMQAIPDVMLYVGYVNDILSFYKEELAGEKVNYIHDRALVTEKTVPETLLDVTDETVAAVGRIRTILGEGEARDAWENFATGYISVHTGNPRYRLQEIIGGKYIMDVASY